MITRTKCKKCKSFDNLSTCHVCGREVCALCSTMKTLCIDCYVAEKKRAIMDEYAFDKMKDKKLGEAFIKC